MTIFRDSLHEQLGTWPIGYSPYGGADFGEIEQIARVVGEGDDTAFHLAWTQAADRLHAQACAAESSGHEVTARALYLKAACFYGKSYHVLFGWPVDPRVIAASNRQIEAFESALALGGEPSKPMRIPFENISMLAWLIPAQGRQSERRPLLILTNGYDGTITDLYFASAVAASRRGYHCLIFDGPGQGTTLIRHGVTLRPDWERVIAAVVDFALLLPQVDAKRIALSGWSLGGYLAPRAASGEARLAACIADPGQASVARGFRDYAVKLGATPQEAGNLGALLEPILAKLEQIIAGDRKLRWSFMQRGYWVNGARNLREYLASVEPYTMEGRIEGIRCPTLFTQAEDDALAVHTGEFFDALQCPKVLMKFRKDEGAGEHCEMRNRSLLNDRVLDWLDDVL
ncbi:alpha/beta hydrolase family protein [Paraburkholderia sp. J76]|uniref:alpha/beta hydrolase family protein n=1 Tax=Paraburkholderia sp. J76 TaxID=2805439 RepID=UPI002ABD80D1|nr:alpha/beta fold hydrolase [Paraburkholderia sp. J76]